MGNAQFDRQTIISAVTNKSMHYLDSGFSTVLLPYGQYEVVKFYSPKNTVSTILGIEVGWSPCENNNLTTKSVIISLVEDNVSPGVNGVVANVSMDAQDGKDFHLVHGEPINAYAYSPSDLGAFENHLSRMVFDDTRHLEVAFYNNTGYATRAQRYVKLFVSQEVTAR